MRVTVVEMRATGMKLSQAELAVARAFDGELFIEPGHAVLCAGNYPSEWPEHGHVLPPLYEPHVRTLRGESFVIVGRYLPDGTYVHHAQPQAWWVRLK